MFPPGAGQSRIKLTSHLPSQVLSMPWSKWLNVANQIAYSGPAIYELRVVNKNGNPFKLNRFLGQDPEGILSIGETNNMEKRRSQFISGITKCYGHSECNLLYYLLKNTAFATAFDSYRLEYRYSSCTTKHDAQQEERVSIKTYICKFGEVPPLNSAIPDRYNGWPVP